MDPFAEPVLNVKPLQINRVKAKASAPSRIEDLSVGAIRYSFLQMRLCEKLDVDLVLWTGMHAGKFALAYLLMSSSMQKKNKKKKLIEDPPVNENQEQSADSG